MSSSEGRVLARVDRNAAVVTTVVVLHIAALWALQSGLLHRAVEFITPAQVLVAFIAPPAPPLPKPQPQPPAAVQPTRSRTSVAAPVLATATLSAEPSPTATSAEPTTPPSPAVAATTPAPAPAPPKLELPSSDADYLQNPKPPYPPLSKRLGEQGTVVVRALIATDGSASEARIERSSGFERLDQAALTSARKWRYVPGKRAGSPEPMWFNVPFHFILE